MTGGAALAEWARPKIKVSDEHKDFSLEQLFPKTFGDWVVDESLPVIVPPPDQQALLEKIYNQTPTSTAGAGCASCCRWPMAGINRTG